MKFSRRRDIIYNFAKRPISVIVVFALTSLLLLSQYITVAANTRCFKNEEHNVSESMSQYACGQKIKEEDYRAFYRAGLLKEGAITEIKETNNGPRYTICFGDIVNEVTVKTDSNSITYHFDQGEIENTVCVEKDRILLDGNLIACENDLEDSSEIKGGNSDWYWSNKVPYGKAGDYNHKIGSGSENNIDFHKSIGEIAYGAFVTIVLGVMGMPLVGAVGLSPVYTWLIKAQPKTHGMSVKFVKYTHKKYKDGYIDPVRKKVIKFVYTWYSKKSYKGKTKNTKNYKIKAYY